MDKNWKTTSFFYWRTQKRERERKSSFFEQKKKPEQLSSKKGTEPSKRIIMLANSCAAAATFGIHTQSNALVTSKIRARKTPKLIRSRVLSNAIAGKPVPPEVRKKIAHLCFTLIFFYLWRRFWESDDAFYLFAGFTLEEEVPLPLLRLLLNRLSLRLLPNWRLFSFSPAPILLVILFNTTMYY